MKSLMQHIRQSLALKLSFSILVLAIPIFVAALGILFVQSRYRIKKEAMERVTSVLSTTVERVDGYLTTIETATNTNAWLAVERMQPDSLLTLSRRIVAMNVNVSGCSITTEPYTFPEYGRYFSAYSVRQGDSIVTVREGEYEYFDKVWYKTPREQQSACWVDPFNDYNEGTLSASDMIASYCRPLSDDEGHFLGIISTDLSLAYLSEAIQKEKPYPGAYYVMLGRQGHIFIHPDSTRLFSQTIFSQADARHQQDIIALGHEMTSGQQGAMQVRVDGRKCLVCYRPIGNTGWSLALVCPESDILSRYNHLTLIILPLIALGLIFILLLCRRVVRHAIQPLKSLLRQSQHIADGRFDQQITTTRRGDAIGRLQNSFASMQQSLRQHMGAIRQANDETSRRNDELHAASQRAEEAGEQKTIFIQNMTHQIRTPLNIIMGFAQVLRDSGRDLPEEELRSIAQMMGHNTMLLNRMVLMLYDSSDTGLEEELHMRCDEEVDCNEVARESMETTRKNFPGLQVTLQTSLPDGFTIRSNRLYLVRSLRELLYNSAKYSDGQHICLALSLTEDGRRVRFVSEDKGPGIDPEYRLQMYEPFTKINDLSEGLGLGLPLTKRHVATLGGTMTLDTDYHEGCRFVIELPV